MVNTQTESQFVLSHLFNVSEQLVVGAFIWLQVWVWKGNDYWACKQDDLQAKVEERMPSWVCVCARACQCVSWTHTHPYTHSHFPSRLKYGIMNLSSQAEEMMILDVESICVASVWACVKQEEPSDSIQAYTETSSRYKDSSVFEEKVKYCLKSIFCFPILTFSITPKKIQ